MTLTLFDTAGQEAFEQLRPMSYPDSEVILLCFSIDNKDIFDNIKEKFIPEIKQYCPKVPLILVGNKIDLRSDNQKSIKYEDGISMANQIGACTYLECSAKTKEGVKVIFETAARIALKGDRKNKIEKKKNKKRKCQIL